MPRSPAAAIDAEHEDEPSVIDEPLIKVSDPSHNAFWKLRVLWEQDGLLALEKPSHLLVSPDKHRADYPVLTKLLQRDINRGATWNRSRSYQFLELIYSLDFETTGIALFATRQDVFEAIRNCVGSRKMVFTHLALSHGVASELDFSIDLKLAPHPARRWLMRVNRTKGKQTLIRCRVLEQFRSFCLLKCRSETVRHHQTRVCLQSHGMPPVGDSLYGGKLLFLSELKRQYRSKRTSPEKPLIDRPAIHHDTLEFDHPLNETPVKIESPMPKDVAASLKFLRQFDPQTHF